MTEARPAVLKSEITIGCWNELGNALLQTGYYKCKFCGQELMELPSMDARPSVGVCMSKECTERISEENKHG